MASGLGGLGWKTEFGPSLPYEIWLRQLGGSHPPLLRLLDVLPWRPSKKRTRKEIACDGVKPGPALGCHTISSAAPFNGARQADQAARFWKVISSLASFCSASTGPRTASTPKLPQSRPVQLRAPCDYPALFGATPCRGPRETASSCPPHKRAVALRARTVLIVSGCRCPFCVKCPMHMSPSPPLNVAWSSCLTRR